MNDELALERLYWFFRMVSGGGPDGSDLDTLVLDEAAEAVDWYDAETEREGDRLPEYDKPKYRRVAR